MENFLLLQCALIRILSKDGSSTICSAGAINSSRSFNIKELSGFWMLQGRPGSVFHLPLDNVARRQGEPWWRKRLCFCLLQEWWKDWTRWSLICCHLALKINFQMAAPELLSSEPWGRLGFKQIGVGLYYLWILDYRSFTFRIALCAL